MVYTYEYVHHENFCQLCVRSGRKFVRDTIQHWILNARKFTQQIEFENWKLLNKIDENKIWVGS